MKLPREIAAAALWVAALALLSFGTVYSATDGHNSPVMPWGIFTAIVALVPTGWILLEHVVDEHEVDVERIAEIVDALHTARQDVQKLH